MAPRGLRVDAKGLALHRGFIIGARLLQRTRMARVSTCLNFPRSTEEAFLFYRSVFGGSFNGHVARFCDRPVAPGQPAMAEADRQLVMHVELPILGGHVLMGSDAPEWGDIVMVLTLTGQPGLREKCSRCE